MWWLLLAVAAHAGNALVFVVDKSLLESKGRISDPLRYTFYSALLAGAGAVLLFFDYTPLTGFIVGWSALAGLFYIVALWFFFRALKEGEPTRVVPVAGSAVPVFTLLLAVLFLGEVLAPRSWGAVGLLIIGGLFLSVSWRGTKGLERSALLGAVMSGLFFAAYYVMMKYLYSQTDTFLAVFAYSRVVQAAVAVGLALVWLWLWRVPPSLKLRRASLPRREPSGRGIIVLIAFIANKVLAAGAFVLLSYVISEGSVTVANALQGTQYVWLLLLAAMVSRWWPKLFQEEVGRVAAWQKVGGVALVSLGLALLV